MTRTPKETAEHMLKQYGKDAIIRANEHAFANAWTNKPAEEYWQSVAEEIRKLKQVKP